MTFKLEQQDLLFYSTNCNGLIDFVVKKYMLTKNKAGSNKVSTDCWHFCTEKKLHLTNIQKQPPRLRIKVQKVLFKVIFL